MNMEEKEINNRPDPYDMAEKEAEKQAENMSWADYDPESLAEYPLENLNLLELVNLRKEVNNHKQQIETCKSMLESVKGMIEEQGLDESTAKTMEANYLEAAGFTEDSTDEFLAFANRVLPSVNDFIKRIEARIDVLKEHGISSKSLTEDMVGLLEKRMGRIDPSSTVNYDYVMKKYNRIRGAYDTRLTGDIHADYFGAKFTSFIRNKKLMRQFKKDCRGNGSDFFNNLKRQYEAPVLNSAAVMMLGDDGGNDNWTYVKTLCICIFYVLNRMLETEAKTDNHVYVDILFSDLMDMRNRTYDLADTKEQMGLLMHAISPAALVMADDLKKANPRIAESRIMNEFDHICTWSFTQPVIDAATGTNEAEAETEEIKSDIESDVEEAVESADE